MGYWKEQALANEGFEWFIEGILDESDDNLTEKPMGKCVNMPIYKGKFGNTVHYDVSGVIYEYSPTQRVFMPDHLPRNYMVLAANENASHSSSNDVGYHNLTMDDL